MFNFPGIGVQLPGIRVHVRPESVFKILRNTQYSRLLSDTWSHRVHGAAGHVYHDFASDVRDDRPGLDSCVRALRTDGAPAREDWDL